MPERGRSTTDNHQGLGCRHRCSTNSPGPLLRSPSEDPQPRLRPILCRSRSQAESLGGRPTQKRSVSFQLPADEETRRSRVAELANRLRKFTKGGVRSKPEKTVKRILRQPVVHVHLRGASGLPTQRVPLATVNASQRQRLWAASVL